MGTPVQFNGEVLILLGRIVSPIGLEALPETFSQGLLGPGKPCRLGILESLHLSWLEHLPARSQQCQRARGSSRPGLGQEGWHGTGLDV